MKTIPLFSIAILLTLCLATNACSAPAKREETFVQPAPVSNAVPSPATAVQGPVNTEVEAFSRKLKQDVIYTKYHTEATNCKINAVQKYLFYYETTSLLTEKATETIKKECYMLLKAASIRQCELIREFDLKDAEVAMCSAEGLEDEISFNMEMFPRLFINLIDKDRAQKGLPPRPSLNK